MTISKKKKINPICLIKTAWLITWEFYAPNADEELKRLGIKNRVINIVDSHRDYEYIIEHTKSIYRLLMASYSEKVSLIKRGKEKMTEDDFFCSHPVRTSYQTDLYKKLLRSSDNLYSKEHKELGEQWKNHPHHIIVGFNPCILARKVEDLKVFKEGSKELIEWYDPLKKKTYRCLFTP